MGAPQLFWCYQAARLAQLSTVYSKAEKPDWIQIETGSPLIHLRLPSLDYPQTETPNTLPISISIISLMG